MESFGGGGWGVEEETEDDLRRGGGGEGQAAEFIDLTGSPSPPPAVLPPPAPRRSSTPLSSWSSPHPATQEVNDPSQEANEIVAVKDESESMSTVERVSSPVKSESGPSNTRSSGDDGGLSDEQKRALLRNESAYIATMLPKCKTKTGKRLLNERLAELTRCLDGDEDEDVSEPASRPYALLSHLSELKDKFGSFSRPPTGKHVVNLKARRKSPKKRVVEDQDENGEDDDGEQQKPETKKPKTRLSSRKSIKNDDDSAAGPSSSRTRVGGTRSDASDIDDQPSTSTSSSLLTPHPVNSHQQAPSTSSINGRPLHRKGEKGDFASGPPRRRASLFTGSTTTTTLKRTRSAGSSGSSKPTSTGMGKKSKKKEGKGEGSEMRMETRRKGKEREEASTSQALEEKEDEAELGGNDSLFGSDE